MMLIASAAVFEGDYRYGFTQIRELLPDWAVLPVVWESHAVMRQVGVVVQKCEQSVRPAALRCHVVEHALEDGQHTEDAVVLYGYRLVPPGVLVRDHGLEPKLAIP